MDHFSRLAWNKNQSTSFQGDELSGFTLLNTAKELATTENLRGNPADAGHVLLWGSQYRKSQYGTTAEISMHWWRFAALWVFFVVFDA